MIIGVHQGSILSPLPFNIIMNYLTKDWINQPINILLYADDIVLVEEDDAMIEVVLEASK